MSNWKARLVVIQGVLRLPDGTEREINVQVNPDMFPGAHGGVFRGVRVFAVHDRPATYDMKIHTDKGDENASRGSTITYAGKPLDLDLSPPKAAVMESDRLQVVPPESGAYEAPWVKTKRQLAERDRIGQG